MKDICLEVKNLKVIYKTEDETVQAVNGVSFQLERGKVLGLVGETGAGKTTIARSILGILPDPPAEVLGGEINFDGHNLLSLPEKEMEEIRGKKISMIFQDPMTALNPVFTIGEQIAEAMVLHENLSRKAAMEKAAQMLELVGIPAGRLNDYPHQFSGGMKQRAVIAMALACDPELLLADEPTTALDVTIQAQVLEMMQNLRKKYNTSIVFITHDLGVVASICDEVAVVYAGEIIEIGSLEDIFDRPAHPYTVGLFKTIPRIDGNETRLTAIPGMPPNPADLPSGCSFNPRCKFAAEKCREGNVGLVEVENGHYCRCCNLNRGA